MPDDDDDDDDNEIALSRLLFLFFSLEQAACQARYLTEMSKDEFMKACDLAWCKFAKEEEE